MSPDISECAFEEAIECGLLLFGPDAHPRRGTPAAEPAPPPYGENSPGLPAEASAQAGGEPFEEKMQRLVAQLRQQQAEAARLDAAIAGNLKELGYG